MAANSFKIVNDSAIPGVMIVKAEENGVHIEQQDCFYKNIITVSANGKTHTLTTPNAGFIFSSMLNVILLIVILCLFIKKYSQITIG